MAASNLETTKFPMLAEILAIKNLPLQPMYTTKNIAEIFSVSARAIQNWISSGQLIPRNLPGRWKFLTQDVEAFLQASQKSAR
jgi:Helix-turn-helix domain